MHLEHVEGVAFLLPHVRTRDQGYILGPVHNGIRVGRISIHHSRWMPIRREYKRHNPWRTSIHSALES